MIPPTTRDDDAPRPTVRDDGSSPSEPTVRRSPLPPELAARFVDIEPVKARGGEADLFFARACASGHSVAIKWYRYGMEPKPENLERIAQMDPAYVIRQLEHGHGDGRVYEVMERAVGSLADLLARPASPDTLREIVTQVSAALRYLHGLRPPLVHRDLKPDNVLLRSSDPLRLVLSDFSFASEIVGGSRVVTTRHRTEYYSAPEAMVGDISPAADWWSLGMIVAEAAGGAHPFAGAETRAVDIHLNNRKPIPLDRVTDPRLKLLCQGLLCYRQEYRWSGDEVERWLRNDSTLRAPVELPEESGALRPFSVGGRQCRTLRELNEALVASPEEALREFGRGTVLRRWLLEELKDYEAAQRFEHYLDDPAFRNLDPSIKLALWLATYRPSLPPVVDGKTIDEAGFLGIIRERGQRCGELTGALSPAFGPQVARAAGADWLTRVYGTWATLTKEAEAFDTGVVQAAGGSIKPLRCAGSTRLLWFGLDPAAQAEALRHLQDSARTPELQACPWMPRIEHNAPAAHVWVAATRIEEAKSQGAAHIQADRQAAEHRERDRLSQQAEERLQRWRGGNKIPSIILYLTALIGLGLPVVAPVSFSAAIITWHCFLTTVIPLAVMRAIVAAVKGRQPGRAFFLGLSAAGLLYLGLGDPAIGYDDYSLLSSITFLCWLGMSATTAVMMLVALSTGRDVRFGSVAAPSPSVQMGWRLVTAVSLLWCLVVGAVGADRLNRLHEVRESVPVGDFAARLTRLVNRQAGEMGISQRDISPGLSSAIAKVQACVTELTEPSKPAQIQTPRGGRPSAQRAPARSACDWSNYPDSHPVFYAVKPPSVDHPGAMHFHASFSSQDHPPRSLADLISVPILQRLAMDADIVLPKRGAQ